MSKSVVIFIENFKHFCKEMVEKWKAMEKVCFPKDYGTHSISSFGVDSIHFENAEFPTFIEGPMDFFELRSAIECDFDIQLENPSPLDYFMPLDSHPTLLKTKIPGERDLRRSASVAISRKKIDQFPVSQRTSAQLKPLRQNVAREVLGIEAFFEEKGLPVREVKLLPSGTTRITLDDLFGYQKVRQSEFVGMRIRK